MLRNPSVMTMTYGCCICRETLDIKKKKGENAPITKPVVTTKCGHLFHPECLRTAFSTKNENAVWKAKECPVCKMSLTVATDLIRIFPSNDPAPEDLGPSVEELQEKTKKYEKHILELRDMLEASFLRNRDSEKAIVQLRKENDKLVESRDQLLNFKSESEARIESLSLENAQLRNTVVSLSKNLAQIDGLNGMGQSGGMNPYARYPVPHPLANNFGFRPPMYSPYGPFPIRHHEVPHQHSGPRLPGSDSRDRIHPMERASRSVSLNHLNNFNMSHDGSNGRVEKLTNTAEERISNHVQGTNKNINLQKDILKEKVETDLTSSVDAFMDDLLKGEGSNSQHAPKILTPDEGQDVKKLYKKYYCDTCQAVWGTSRSVGNRPQICRKCSSLVLPYAECPVITRNDP